VNAASDLSRRRGKQQVRSEALLPYLSLPMASLLAQSGTDAGGLSSAEAQRRLVAQDPKALGGRRRGGRFGVLLSQFKSPIVLILLFAAMLSFFVQDPTDALVILGIVSATAALGAWQEGSAERALEELVRTVRTRSVALRDGREQEVPLEEIVPGDIVPLSAGSAVPGDGRLLEARDLFLLEATLTGETLPVEKHPGVCDDGTPIAARSNAVFLGTHVASGTGKMVVVRTGRNTEFGGIAGRLALRRPETEFERGVRRFGYLLMEVTFILVLVIFAINVALHRPVIDSLLFSLAIAVGLTPQLLPAIVTVNLARGARDMARHRVIVRRLHAIENLGSMNILCSDKTGTLTEGVMRLYASYDARGDESQRTRLLGHLNAAFSTSFRNPLDDAIRASGDVDTAGYERLDEIPYDFVRKRLSVLLASPHGSLLVTKGAVASVLAICETAETSDGAICSFELVRPEAERTFRALSDRGLRTLAVATRMLGDRVEAVRDDESALCFSGFLVFEDRAKSGVRQTIDELRALGVQLKIITGDSARVATHVAEEVGLPAPRLLTGSELRQMSAEALRRRVDQVELFAEVEPNQKEQVILALKQGGHVVGFLGDGINDASALHAADVGISVDSAADVAKEAAEFVLLEKDLGVLRAGIEQGRRTFLNTLKYVFMATSANFGNMFSVAGASALLPFLPMLPKQILLINFLTDLPEMTIAGDNVDERLLRTPQRWNIRFIRRFMVVFGLLSSLFDYVTFGVLFLVPGSTPTLFRSGWFVESVLSASLVVFVLRSRLPLGESRPSRTMLGVTLVVTLATLALPFSPLAAPLELAPLPMGVLAAVLGIVAAYFGLAELVKRGFYRRELANR
jgi:Mg2+-importing ATPase